MMKTDCRVCYPVKRILLSAVVLMAILSCNAIITQAATFSPRLSAPAANSPYYSNGAYNPFVTAVGTLSNVPNCTTYAWGRAYEILGTRPPLPTGNAKDWYGAASNKGPTPKLGAVACWNGGSWGHVAVVEEINGNNLTLSESSYSPSIYWQLSYKNATNMGAGFQGYIYIGDFSSHNPVGYLDVVRGRTGTVYVKGWVFDPDDMTKYCAVHVYIGGEGHEIIAKQERIDVHNVYGCGYDHGFEATIETKKTGTQTVEVYGINIGDGSNQLLGSQTVDIIEKGSEMTSGYGRAVPDGDYLIATAGNSDKTKFYYLDIFGTEFPAKSGTNVDLAGPTSGDPPAYEIWTLKYSDGYYTIMQKGTNMSLDVYGKSQKNGANIAVSSYNGGSNQKWAISLNGKNGYKIQAKNSGYCVDIVDWKIANGTNIQQCKDNGSDAQSWLFIPYKPAQTLEDGRYILLSAMDTKKELDVKGSTSNVAENTNVQIWDDTADSRTNSFDVKKLSNGYYKITHAGSGKSLDLTSAISTYDANVALHTANNSVAQQWAITKDGYKGGYTIRVKCSGYALDINKANTANGTNVTQCPINYGKNQTWIFVPAEYTVNYDLNGGSGSIASQKKYYKEPLTISSSRPTRSGYTFTGWNTKKSGGGTNYAPGSSYTTDSDTILCAQWQQVTSGSDNSGSRNSSSGSSATSSSGTTNSESANSDVQNNKIKPTLPAVKISKPKVAKNSVVVKWKKIKNKDLKKIKKIQIQISTNKNFNTGVKTVTANAKKRSKKVKGLKKGKKYYVRIRGINGNQISKWSKVKSFKSK